MPGFLGNFEEFQKKYVKPINLGKKISATNEEKQNGFYKISKKIFIQIKH
jgi:hypothetical protein